MMILMLAHGYWQNLPRRDYRMLKDSLSNVFNLLTVVVVIGQLLALRTWIRSHLVKRCGTPVNMCLIRQKQLKNFDVLLTARWIGLD